MPNDRYTLVAIDMGYGHLRPAYALADAPAVDQPNLAARRRVLGWLLPLLLAESSSDRQAQLGRFRLRAPWRLIGG